MSEQTHNVGNEIVFGQVNTFDNEQFETVGVDVYSQGSLLIADLTHVNSLSILSVYDNKGVIVKSVKSNGSEIVKIRVPTKGVNRVQIQNGTNLFIQELTFH
ncbi:MAG: hypothetical protein WCG93_00445 [Paludibacter sp.]